jgi:hypothetical protein
MNGMIERGARHPFTLRVRDHELESTFQQEEGEAGLGGYRIITAATVLLWAVAAVLIPLGTDITFGSSGAALAVEGTNPRRWSN